MQAGKRSLALILAIITLLSAIPQVWAMTIIPPESSATPFAKTLGAAHDVVTSGETDREKTKVTLREAIWSNYGDNEITETERDLLRNNCLTAGRTFTFCAPDKNNRDAIVVVDLNSKTITANEYKDPQDPRYTWHAVSVKIENDNDAENDAEDRGQTIPLSEGQTETEYTFVGASYDVKVTYEMTEPNPDTKIAEKLLGAAKSLYEAKERLVKLKAAAGDVDETLDTAMTKECSFDLNNFYGNPGENKVPLWELLQTYCSKDGIPCGLEGLEDYPVRYEGDEAQKAKALADAYDDQRPARDGKLSEELSNYLDENNAVIDAYSFLRNNASQLRRYIKNKIDQVNAVITVLQDLYNNIDTDNYELSEQIATAIVALQGENYDPDADAKTNLFSHLSYDKMENDPLYRVQTLVSGGVTGITDQDRNDLTDLVNSLNRNSFSDPTPAAKPLMLDTTVVTCHVECKDIPLTVSASVYKDNSVEPEKMSESIDNIFVMIEPDRAKVMSDIDLRKEIEQVKGEEIKKFEQECVGKWNASLDKDLEISDQHYENCVIIDKDKNGTVCGYRVEYKPKSCVVTYVSDEMRGREEYYYGAYYTFDSEASASEYSYEVTVEDSQEKYYYSPGQQIRVLGNMTVTKKDAVGVFHYRDIALNYMVDDSYGSNVLKQSALKIDGALPMPVPTSDNVEFKETEELVASTCEGWIPITAVFQGTEGAVTGELKGPSDGKYAAPLPPDVTVIGATVEYKLQFNEWGENNLSKGEIQALCNIPKMLAKNAEDQLAVMDTLVGYIPNLKMLQGELSQVGDPGEYRSRATEGMGIKPETLDAAEDVLNHCCRKDSEGRYTLLILDHLAAYEPKADPAEQLTYYYQNYNAIMGQISRVSDNLKTIMEDHELEDLVVEFSSKEAYDELQRTQNELEDIRKALTAAAPDVHIDRMSAKLEDLARAVCENREAAQSYSFLFETAPVLTTALNVPAPGYQKITLAVRVNDWAGNVKKEASDRVYFVKSDVLSEDSISQLKTMLGGLKTEAGVDEAHYECNDKLPEVDEPLNEEKDEISYTFTYVPKTYTVRFADENGEPLKDGSGKVLEKEFPYDNPTVELPKSEDGSMSYEYWIDGVYRTGADYTFTQPEIDHLFENETYTIERKVTYTERAIVVKAGEAGKEESVYVGDVFSEVVKAVNDSEKTGPFVLTINREVKADQSVELKKAIEIIGAGKLNGNGQAIKLNNDAKISADAKLSIVASGVEGFSVKELKENSKYHYYLIQDPNKIETNETDFTVGAKKDTALNTAVIRGDRVYLDVQPSGITAKQLKSALVVSCKDGGTAAASVQSNDGDLVTSGVHLTLSGNNKAEDLVIVIVGDVNANGILDSGDAVKIRRHFLGIDTLTGAALAAADLNGIGGVDSGDVVCCRNKYLAWYGESSDTAKKNSKAGK